MTKSDLKTGMILELRNGEKAMVLIGTEHGDIFSGENWGSLNNTFRDDLSSVYSKPGDVIKIYQPITNMYYLNKLFNLIDTKLIWERKEGLDGKTALIDGKEYLLTLKG